MKATATGFVRLALGFAAAACGASLSAQGQTASVRSFAALVPPDAVICAQVASLDALVQAVREAVGAFGEDVESIDRETLFEGLRGRAGDASQIDGTRAIAFALVAPKGTRPLPIFFVPAKDSAKYAASLSDIGMQAVAADDYVVVPLGGTYARPATASPLANTMPAGLAAVRVDVTKAEANLGVVIRSGIDVFQRQMAQQMEMVQSGFDGEAMAELYGDLGRVLLAAGKTLDIAIDEKGGQLSMTAAYVAEPDSDLDGWSSPPVDVSAFAGKLDAKAGVTAVGTVDWAKIWPKTEPMLAALLDIYPPPLRASMQRLMAVYQPLYARLGPVMVTGIDFTDGLRADVHLAPPDAEALGKEIDALLARPEWAELGVAFTSGPGIVDGTTFVRDHKMTFDPSRLSGAAADDAQAKAAVQQVNAVMQALFGTDGMPLQLALRNGAGAMHLGKASGDVKKLLAPAAGAWPSALQPALAAVAGCNPMFVEQLDMAAVVRAMGAFAPPEARDAMSSLPADAKADFVLGGGVRGAEWRAYLAFDLAGFGKLVQALQH